MTLVKSATKKSFGQKKFAHKNYFLGLRQISNWYLNSKKCTQKSFGQKTKVMCTFLKLVRKDGFFDAPLDLFKEKTINHIENLNSQKWKKPHSISENCFY